MAYIKFKGKIFSLNLESPRVQESLKDLGYNQDYFKELNEKIK
jgi:hypothetical protein